MKQNLILDRPQIEEASDLVEPISLAEMKTFLFLSADETFNDALITGFIKTARKQIEEFLNMAIVNKTVSARIQNDFGYMRLPYSGPVMSITSVTDDDGNVINSDSYKLKGSLFSAYSSSLATPRNNFYEPCYNVVNVVYDVSYDEEHPLPEHFKTAVQQQCAWLYEKGRGDEVESAIAPIVTISMKGYKLVV